MEDPSEVFFPTKFHKQSVIFFNAYDFEKVTVCPDKKMKGLKSRTQRVCRFCGLKYGEVFFKKDAHIISELLGNQYLVSDFECDDCNQSFSIYESHLSHFIGGTRAFQKLYGTQKNYKFKSPDKKILAENFNLYGLENSFSVSREDVEDQTFEYNRQTGETLINFIKHSYSPLLVYKSILKIALSCLPEIYLENYSLAFKYIQTNLLDDKIKGAANVFIYSTPPGIGYNTPFVALYKKKDEKRKICTHVFVMYFLNQIYQIVLPLNSNDLNFYSSELMEVIYCPPIFGDKETSNTVPIYQRHLDMSSMELVKGEKETVGFKDVSESVNEKVFDPKTNDLKDDGFNFDAITKLVFMPNDSHIILPEKN